MKMEKGQPGYIKARKLRYLVWAVAEFGIVAAIIILGYVQTGNRLNLFTVVGIVGCLPAAKMLVEFITMAPHKSIAPERYQEIQNKASLLTRVYDLIITSNEKVMPVEAMVISGHVVCGYSESPKTDETELARHLKSLLKANRMDKITVKIFHDYDAFLARAEGMNNMASVDGTGTGKRERSIKNIILSTAM